MSEFVKRHKIKLVIICLAVITVTLILSIVLIGGNKKDDKKSNDKKSNDKQSLKGEMHTDNDTERDTGKTTEMDTEKNNDRDIETETEKETENIPKNNVDDEPGLEKLKVSGTSLLGESGRKIQLRGLSTHGLSWFPEYVNRECISQLNRDFGINVLRLAMYTAEYNGYCTGGDQNYLKDLIDKGVTYATENNMYVIIDWHILSDSNPNIYIAEAKNFFAEMSRKYAGNVNVIYEICNEPNGGTSWRDVKNYALQVIPEIRKNSPDAVILVGTPNWCQYLNQATDDPITEYGNIMYTAHFYAATHTDGLRNEINTAMSKGLPVFVSEFGICDASGNGAIDEKQAYQWINYMNEKGISYVMWNISNKNETSAIFNSWCNKVNGFTYDDLSAAGKWFLGVNKNS